MLRSPHPHARIKSIDAIRALALPGVKAVVTSAELPQPTERLADQTEGAFINHKFLSNNCLADDKALYKGHAVAAVAATSQHIADQALELIDVDYEVLPFVVDVLDSMKENAPVLHERLANVSDPNVRPGGLRADEDTGKSSNIANHYVFELGDLDQGFSEADVVIEREFRTQSVHLGYIEPHTATAMWGEDGKLTIWCSSQGQFNVRDQTALILGIPVSNVRVIPLEIGGGFGGKTLVYLEPVASLRSKKTGQPVKVSMSRAEVFEGTGPTSGSYLKVKMGANREGNITTAYRAPGAPAAAFAAETVIDEICEKLKIDPLEFRSINGAKEETRRITGPRFPRIGYLETLEAAKNHEHYRAPLEGKNRGRGVASGFWFNGGGPASATASVNSDGTVSLVEGSPDIGGTRAAVAMQLAEVLGIAAEHVRPNVGDTDSIGWTSMTGGSGVAFKTGWAAYEAALDVKQQLIQRAAKIWDGPVEDVQFEGAVVSHKSDPELRLTFKQIAARLTASGGPVVG